MEPISAAIAGGAALLGQGANMAFQGKMNKKTRAFAREQYAKQVADNERFWHMQNDYNSPTSQMARLREAGLNPRLIYGASSGGAAGQAPSLDAPSSQSWNPDAPKMDLGEVAGTTINTMYDLRMKNQLYDNAKADNTIKMETAEQIKAQTNSIKTNNALATLELDLNSKYSKDMRDALLQKANMDIRLMTRDDEYKMFQNMFMDKSFDTRLHGLKSTNELRDVQTKLQQADLRLKSKGIQPGDPVYLRIMTQMFGEKFNDIKKLLTP